MFSPVRGSPMYGGAQPAWHHAGGAPYGMAQGLPPRAAGPQQGAFPSPAQRPQVGTPTQYAQQQHQQQQQQQQNFQQNAQAVPRAPMPAKQRAGPLPNMRTEQLRKTSSAALSSPVGRGKSRGLIVVPELSAMTLQMVDSMHEEHSQPEINKMSDPTASIHDFFELDMSPNGVLGRGAYGMVVRAHNKASGGEVAVKILRTDNVNSVQLTNLKNEVKLSLRIVHRNVVRLINVYEERSKLYLVYELMRGGDLTEAMMKRRSLTESLAASVLAQVIEAVMHCHNLGIMHRDLKLDNIMLVNADDLGHVKVTDFGLSTAFKTGGIAFDSPEMTDERLHSLVGTIDYIAPEVLLGLGYDWRSDYYSLGVILYLLLSGCFPWHGGENDIAHAVVHQPVPFPAQTWHHVSESGRDLVSRLMEKDPNRRLVGMNVLMHPWFLGSAGTEKFPQEIVDRLIETRKAEKAEESERIRRRQSQRAERATHAASEREMPDLSASLVLDKNVEWPVEARLSDVPHPIRRASQASSQGDVPDLRSSVRLDSNTEWPSEARQSTGGASRRDSTASASSTTRMETRTVLKSVPVRTPYGFQMQQVYVTETVPVPVQQQERATEHAAQNGHAAQNAHAAQTGHVMRHDTPDVPLPDMRGSVDSEPSIVEDEATPSRAHRPFAASHSATAAETRKQPRAVAPTLSASYFRKPTGGEKKGKTAPPKFDKLRKNSQKSAPATPERARTSPAKKVASPPRGSDRKPHYFQSPSASSQQENSAASNEPRQPQSPRQAPVDKYPGLFKAPSPTPAPTHRRISASASAAAAPTGNVRRISSGTASAAGFYQGRRVSAGFESNLRRMSNSSVGSIGSNAGPYHSQQHHAVPQQPQQMQQQMPQQQRAFGRTYSATYQAPFNQPRPMHTYGQQYGLAGLAPMGFYR